MPGEKFLDGRQSKGIVKIGKKYTPGGNETAAQSNALQGKRPANGWRRSVKNTVAFKPGVTLQKSGDRQVELSAGEQAPAHTVDKGPAGSTPQKNWATIARKETGTLNLDVGMAPLPPRGTVSRPRSSAFPHFGGGLAPPPSFCNILLQWRDEGDFGSPTTAPHSEAATSQGHEKGMPTALSRGYPGTGTW